MNNDLLSDELMELISKLQVVEDDMKLNILDRILKLSTQGKEEKEVSHTSN